MPRISKEPPASATETAFRWHAEPDKHVLDQLATRIEGLTPAEVAARRASYGPNNLPTKPPPSVLLVFLRQFRSPLIYILLVAALISLAIGDLKDAGFIFAVIILNAAIGTFQEYRAERSAAALQSLIKVMAHVKRAGEDKVVSAEDLVPGDMVVLESGNRVPADLRLLRVNSLTIDESFLTGESLVVEKITAPQADEARLSERVNMAFAGSSIASGRGLGVVIATGLKTEVGKIARSVTETVATKPPLLIRMERFARRVSLLVLGASVLLAVVAALQGMAFTEVFFLAVALAVSAIPEGLPVALTVALAVATSRMAKRNVVVRRLAAVESLGSCTLIGSDKTGTLTVNQQTAKVVAFPSGSTLDVSGQGYNADGDVLKTGEALEPSEHLHVLRLARVATICNEASLVKQEGVWNHHGDAIDVAFLALAYKLGLVPAQLRAETTVLKEIPFEAERRYAASVYQEHGRTTLALKGALEALLPHCTSQMGEHRPEALNPATIEQSAQQLSERGYRVLAVAEAILEDTIDLSDITAVTTAPLTLLGLVGFIDPLRAETKDAVAACRRAGVKVIMITGDHPSTAFAIAKDLGIAQAGDVILTGQKLEHLGTPESSAFTEAVNQAQVFARVTPLQKLQVVEALQKAGHFVAVTGDGVNDAPAMRKASIGVAMGSGTDVAKDTASMIITDDNFASIVAGVEEGRFAYDNIRKVTYLLISTGVAEIVLFMLALAFGLPLPFVAVQLLWLNLVTNGIQDVALAFEQGEAGAMRRPPRHPKEGIIDGLMLQQMLTSGLTIALVTFSSWAWLLAQGWDEASARNLILLLMVLLQNVHVFNCRSERTSAFRIPLQNNYLLIAGVVLAQGIHILSMQLPFMQALLGLEPVSVREWLLLLALAFSVLMVMEVFKWFKAQNVNSAQGNNKELV